MAARIKVGDRRRPWRAPSRGTATTWVAAFGFAVVAAACTPVSTAEPPSSHIDRVIEDVGAMIEGMAAAHGGRMAASQAPDFRSNVR